MMMDGKGAALIAVILAIIGFVIGLGLYWLGLPWWVPLVGALLPVAVLAVIVVWLILSWMAAGSH